MFNHSVPPAKSNIFDIKIRNSQIADTDIQTLITDKLKQRIPKIIPGYTNTRDIAWTNEISS